MSRQPQQPFPYGNTYPEGYTQQQVYNYQYPQQSPVYAQHPQQQQQRLYTQPAVAYQQQYFGQPQYYYQTTGQLGLSASDMQQENTYDDLESYYEQNEAQQQQYDQGSTSPSLPADARRPGTPHPDVSRMAEY
ncbi:uncharacterized protein LTR77_006690 [Saxophila tyrrhenica]|uniref:Uncharacterized protein n=1 Tax=Saxophila tyrrhenica TaxID=1690608 RepID=A0AAV9P5N3_9PEZI|nr:hypothetical protein LTR77_006690 [Saxophila tyrrhenica]